ncbi:DgyrCDS8046 [Dimorphilus gyrociliatus]|uniref:DgyrCDS8046 n=1 Tax=Dimorphilus gyrociliatus TaxID=2664684 RepID=A0A7I8VY04_9ANNE|nr:DgyrCDS8046 [Dimorphilus gyrociliatus]
MDEYRQATTTHINSGFNADLGQRFAHPENTSFYSEDESFSRMADQPSMHSSYTQESGRIPHRYHPQNVPATRYYESPAQSVVPVGQSDQSLLFNYQPQWMKNMKVDTYTGGQAETTMDQSTYSKKEFKIRTYLIWSVLMLIFFLPCGTYELTLLKQ